jgi:cytochrome P450
MPDATPVYFNPWDPAFRNDPYPYYAPMLAGPPPLIEWGAFKIVLVARYADAVRILRNHENFSSMGPPPPPEAYQGRLAGSRNLINTDPPVHSRLRRLVSRDFTPRRIRELEPRIRQIARAALDAAKAMVNSTWSKIWPTPCR